MTNQVTTPAKPTIDVKIITIKPNQWEAAIRVGQKTVAINTFNRLMDAVDWVNGRLSEMAIEFADQGV